MKAKDLEHKTSDLVPTFSITFHTSIVFCAASFVDSTDPAGQPVVLESDAVVSCNNTPMDVYTPYPYYGVSLPYVPDQKYLITVFRPQDGSTLVYSAYPQ